MLFAYVPYWWFSSADARRVASLEHQLSAIRGKSRAIAEANLRLRAEIDALESDPRAIEDVARETLGMVRAGELVIRLESAEGSNKARRGPMQ